jgi:FtsH-binding integral membrane protein
MNISTGVFERTGSHDITESSFYGLISFFVLLGLAVTAGAAHYAGLIGYSPHLGGTLILGLALPILGIVISSRTDNPSVAFLGYLLISGSFGFLLGPIGNQYSPHVLRDVAGMTGGIAIIMGLAGITFPQVFSRLGGALFVSLIGLLILRIIALFVPSFNFSWIDYLGAGIFSLYIGYDMWRASEASRSALSAIQVAVSLYLDVLNLFLTLLNASRRD